MNRLSFFSRLLTFICLACFLMAQNACIPCPCDEVACTNPVVDSPSYYNSQYELSLNWTEESNTTYSLNAYSSALQQVIAYDVQGGNTTLQLGQLHPLTLSAETECCQTETPIELAATCDYPDSFSVSISPTIPFLATFEWSPVSGASEYLITVFDSLGNNIQTIALPATPTTAEVQLTEDAYYAVIQTLCENGEYSPPSGPVRTTQVDPLISTVDVEKINEEDGVWKGRVTLDPFERVRFIEPMVYFPADWTSTTGIFTVSANDIIVTKMDWKYDTQRIQITVSPGMKLPLVYILPTNYQVTIEVQIKTK